MFASKFGWSKSDTLGLTLQEAADLIQMEAEVQAKVKALEAANGK